MSTFLQKRHDVDGAPDPHPRGARRLRQLFARPGLIRVAGAHNALGACLAQRAGFDAIWSSGLELSASHTVPDANILTMSEFLFTAQCMADAVVAPIIADCDTGFGNANNVIHMVRRFEAAGVAAVCIEDKQFPKINSFIAGRQDLASVPEFVGKIRAAKSTQRDPDFMVIARIEALIAGWGLDEALQRARQYVAAGADAILIHSKSSQADEIAAFLRRWNGLAPVVVVPTTYPSARGRDLEQLGVKMVIYANHGLRASVRAMEDVLSKILEDDGTEHIEQQIAPMSLIFELQGVPQLREDERRFLRTGVSTRAIILAARDHCEDPTLSPLTSRRPLSMLDLNGKSVLARQVETLNASGVREVCVVTGYRAEEVRADGARLVLNPEWAQGNQVSSLLRVRDPWDGRTLLAYGDVVFERHALTRLLESTADVTVLIDLTYDPRQDRPEHAVDRVAVDGLVQGSRRALAPDGRRKVRQIAGVAADEANAEFAGLALFSERGFGWLMQVCAQRPDLSVPDAVQRLIDEGHEVACAEVASGWIEIRTLDDYELCLELTR